MSIPWVMRPGGEAGRNRRTQGVCGGEGSGALRPGGPQPPSAASPFHAVPCSVQRVHCFWSHLRGAKRCCSAAPGRAFPTSGVPQGFLPSLWQGISGLASPVPQAHGPWCGHALSQGSWDRELLAGCLQDLGALSSLRPDVLGQLRALEGRAQLSVSAGRGSLAGCFTGHPTGVRHAQQMCDVNRR